MSAFDRHSPAAQAAYHDLVSLLLDERASDVRGSPEMQTRAGRDYWYDRVRVGADVRLLYIGEDSPELRARLARHAELKEIAATRQAERSRLVRLLRAERFQSTDAETGALLSAFARVGAFRLGATLVGTHAFRL